MIELHIRQVCDVFPFEYGSFLWSSIYSAHVEGMCSLVTLIMGQTYMVVTRIYTDARARAVGFGLSRESWMLLKRRVRLRHWYF